MDLRKIDIRTKENNQAMTLKIGRLLPLVFFYSFSMG